MQPEQESEAPSAEDSRNPIAIVGMACRFPGAANPTAFWQLLSSGTDAIGPIPDDRPELASYFDPTPGMPGRFVTREGGFLTGLDRFDADFFGISPREATFLDPQQRLLLETAWEGFEDAGIAIDGIVGSRTGVFVGMWTNEYEDYVYGSTSDIDLYTTTGGGRYSASGRLSYAFDLRGPSMTLDTACSSSLVAIHLACQSLRSKESDLALAAGVNLILQPHISIGYSRSRMLSPRGRCRFGDASADGYVRSEGCGLLVLKPLSRALADGDRIQALVLGSAVNNDGRGSGLLVAPSATGQQAMLRDAYRNAGVAPGSVEYVEAHGTGTRVGDPVELEALSIVLGDRRPPDRPCLVGSVKTNIGHAEAASGMAGVIKTVLALQHGVVPPSLHLTDPSPSIPWQDLPLVVARESQSWPTTDGRRLAGVNSFGITGTNAHVVLQSAPAIDDADGRLPSPRPLVLSVSAKTEGALRELSQALATTLSTTRTALEDICYTLANRRTHLDHRVAVVAQTREEASELLKTFAADQPGPGIAAGQVVPGVGKCVFVFSGQGSQWIGMGRLLYRDEPVFRAKIEACDAAIRRGFGWSVIEALTRDAESARLSQVDVVQPLLFSMQVALASLWQSWGVQPAAAVGHSMGEVAAAHCAGVLSLDDAVTVICTRSLLLKRTSGKGAMAVIGLSFDRTAEAIAGLDERLSIAVSNSPGSTVVSGDPSTLDDLLSRLEREDVFCRRVKVDVASHSPQMDPLCGELFAGLQHIRPQSGSVPMQSTVSVETVDGRELNATYWVRNLRQPVLFSSAVQRLIASGHVTFIEVSPHPLLVSSIHEMLQVANVPGVVIGSLSRDQDERHSLAAAAGQLWAAGFAIDWMRVQPPGRCVPLPTYPWQRQRYWFDGGTPRRSTAGVRPRRSWLGKRLVSPAPTFALELSAGSEPWAVSARADDVSFANPAVWILSAAAAAAGQLGGDCALEQLELAEPIQLPSVGDLAVQAMILPSRGGNQTFSVSCASLSEDPAAPWRTCVSGRIGNDGMLVSRGEVEPLSSLRSRFGGVEPTGDTSGAPPGRHVDVDGAPRAIAELWTCGHETLAHLAAREQSETPAGAEAAILQAGFDLCGVSDLARPGYVWVADAIDRVWLTGKLRDAAWCHVDTHPVGDSGLRVANAAWYDPLGQPTARFEGLQLRAVRAAALAAAHRARTRGWSHEVRWVAAGTATHASADPGGTWILLGTESALATTVAVAIRGAGGAAVVARIGSEYKTTASDLFEVDPLSISDYVRLVEEVERGTSSPLAGILHLVAAGDVPTDTSLEHVVEQARLGGLSAIRAAQALQHVGRGKLWLVTTGAQPAAHGDRIDVARASIWGVGRALELEEPGRFGGLLDLETGTTPDSKAQVIVDSLRGVYLDKQLARRADVTLAPRLMPVGNLPRIQEVSVLGSGAYLVTGGFGRLGLRVARWLAEQGARDLVLVGRRGLPAREQWSTLPTGSPLFEQAQAVDEIESLGARVEVRSLDIADPKAMADLFALFTTDRPLRGVVHAAGQIDACSLAELTAQRFDDISRAKIQGAWLLHECTRAQALDFFVLFSSGASVWGSRFLAHYAAANHTLDALAAYRRRLGLPALSINWGWWEGGSTEGDAELLFARSGLLRMQADDALYAMWDALREGSAQRVIAAINWSLFQPALESVGSRLVTHMQAREGPAESGTRGYLRRQVALLDPSDALARVGDCVRQELGEVLRLDPKQLDPARGFFKLGMDSLMTLELRHRLESAVGETLPATIAFEYPTVLTMSRFLAERVLRIAPHAAADPTNVAVTHAADAHEASLDVHSEDELASMLDDELARLLNQGKVR